MKYLIITVIIIVSSLVFSQNNSFPKVFLGKWKMEFDKAEIYEEWVVVNDYELVGISYSIKDAVKSVSENLYLKKFANNWAYVAIPVGQSPTLFNLVGDTGKKFLFENKEHDFPKRIIYEFHEDGKLSAIIEGTIDGEYKRKIFSFRIVEE